MKTNLNLLLLCCVAVVLLALSSCRKDNNFSPQAPTPSSPDAKARTLGTSAIPAGFKVVGYMPSWAGNISQVQFTKLTHVIYAFVLPTNSGGLTAIDGGRLSSLASAAHANGVKVS